MKVGDLVEGKYGIRKNQMGIVTSVLDDKAIIFYNIRWVNDLFFQAAQAYYRGDFRIIKSS